MRKTKKPEKTNQGDSRKGSFAEQAAHLRGIVEGPRDLSSNPARLDGFGAVKH
jgi:hypothetical protein